MPLSDMTCKTAKPESKSYKLFDGEGLYLEVMPSGSKLWRQKYRMHGVEKRMSFGKYPEISLLEAREKKTAHRKLVQAGEDPYFVQVARLQKEALNRSHTFEDLALEWHSKQVASWKPSHADTILHRFEKYIFPFIAGYPLCEIKPLVVLNFLQKAEVSAPELSRRLKSMCSHVFKYAIATGRAENDPTYGLETAMKKFKKGHYASITVDEFPAFLFAMHEYRDRIYRQTYLALRMLLLTFVRTNELIDAKWVEIDFDNAMWTIPGERMKMKLPHLIPLSRQAITILHELKKMNENREYIFPSYSQPRKPMCKNTMLAAIKRMGYNGRMTGHGFRSLALGLLKEKLGYSHEIADRQLAHVPKSNIDRAYDRAQFLPQRIEMMQKFADFIDETFIQIVTKNYSTKDKCP